MSEQQQISDKARRKIVEKTDAETLLKIIDMLQLADDERRTRIISAVAQFYEIRLR